VIEEKQINSRSDSRHCFGHVTGSLFHGVHIKSVRNNYAIEPHLVAEQIAQNFVGERGRQFIRSTIQRRHHDMRGHYQANSTFYRSAKWNHLDRTNPLGIVRHDGSARDASRWKYRHVPENAWLLRLLQHFAGRE